MRAVKNPRVSVGVPTFNRAASLPRTLESVLGQTYEDLELLIADNASTDGTADLCARFADRDRRVRVIRQERNVGLTANFNTLFERAAGELVMVLADDDWLEPDYVEDCVAALDADPELVIASGGARYHADGEVLAGVELDLLDERPEDRVRRYFRHVRDNVTIYGVMRRSALANALPMQNKLAGDWLLCARMAMQGRVRTVSSTWVNRSTTGASSTFAETVRSMGLTDREARRPQFSIAAFVYADVGRDAPVYAPLGAFGRRALALASASAVLRARPLDVVHDVVGPALRRPRLRWVDRAGRSLARQMRR